jgi:hypothetical protein
VRRRLRRRRTSCLRRWIGRKVGATQKQGKEEEEENTLQTWRGHSMNNAAGRQQAKQRNRQLGDCARLDASS